MIESDIIELYRPQKLIVIDHNRERLFGRAQSSSAIPYFIPADKPDNVDLGFYIDESIFLPIINKVFNTDRDHYFFGYRFIFTCTGHNSLSLANDTRINGVTTIEIDSDINRFKYYINDSSQVIIQKDFDYLMPTQTIKLQGPTVQMSEAVVNCIQQKIDLYCNWYCDKKV